MAGVLLLVLFGVRTVLFPASAEQLSQPSVATLTGSGVFAALPVLLAGAGTAACAVLYRLFREKYLSLR